MGIACFLLYRFRNVTSIPARLFSSSAVIRQPADGPELPDRDCDGDVYRCALKQQRPSTVNCWEMYNRVSLIGTIERPFTEFSRSSQFGVRTCLRVKASVGACRDLMLGLTFREEMARMSVCCLKPHDLIYVSGRLESYMKTENGVSKCYYQVDVREVNFVTQHGLGQPADGNVVRREPMVSAEEMKQKRRDRLHLWHIFFANPYEWWDNRNGKRKSNAPDFKHKDTGEALWLKETDPPWIKQQLELLDSRLIKRSPGGIRNARLHLSPFIYDD